MEKNISLSASVIGISAFSFMAYKKLYNKSTGWKIAMGLIGASSLYTSYQYFLSNKSVEATSGSEKKPGAFVNAVFIIFIKSLNKNQ